MDDEDVQRGGGREEKDEDQAQRWREAAASPASSPWLPGDSLGLGEVWI